MINTDNLCMSCMREIGNEKQCPYCGFKTDSLQLYPYLPIRTVVKNRYIIGKLLEYNGEGATYIAWDIAERRPVTVREFFPDTIAVRREDYIHVAPKLGCEVSFRECSQSFWEMWGKLTKLRGLSALIFALDVFEDHGTVCSVSEYIEGMTLREYLLGSKTGYIKWEKARQLFMPVLSTLGTLHTNGIIHRGISPVTLIIGKDGKMRISGFCIPQARTARGEINAQLFPGYAAVEQYGFKGQQGPWTDIYSFGAVLYRALIGSDPIEATTRVINDKLMVPGRFAEQLPAYVINGLVNALQIMPEDRTRTVEQLRAEITASPTAAAAEEKYAASRRTAERKNPSYQPARQSEQRPPQQPQKSQKSGMVSLKALLICVLIGFVVFVIVSFTVLPDEYNVFSRLFDSSSEEETTEMYNASETYQVPNFKDKSYNDVIYSEYYKTRFSFKAEYVYDDEVEMGYIISQSIEPESIVKAGTEITLTVSKGVEKITLPNVVGYSYDSAYRILTERGFKVSKTEKTNDGYHLAGEVSDMSKTPDVQYSKGEEVVLLVFGEIETEAPVTDPPTTTTTTTAPETTTATTTAPADEEATED
ncbi:MAG: PASTA domain-containing protein [Clostridiales bacterium]|nr:PASTA domain-containing protein [Clostridiales bacterium]